MLSPRSAHERRLPQTCLSEDGAATLGQPGHPSRTDHLLPVGRLQQLQAARYEAAAHVERILDRLPERERQMMQVISELAPEERRLTVIAHGMGFDSVTQAGPTARRLDTARGIIGRGSRYTFRHRAIEAYLTSSWPHSPA